MQCKVGKRFMIASNIVACCANDGSFNATDVENHLGIGVSMVNLPRLVYARVTFTGIFSLQVG